ncbi:MAG: hypothetical protein Q7J73_04345 [Dehalococcoidales bacterium]|nr:hypothetical protein [Dehalococcoidales bacterium]
MLRRVLKKLGLALILLPEPFTTPLGVVLLGAAYVFSRIDRVDSARQLRGFMNLYFRHARPVGQTGKIIQHKLKQRLIDYAWRFEPDLPEKDIRYNLEISRLILRYAERMSNLPVVAKPVHHSMKQRWESYILPEPPRSIEAVQRTVIHKIDDSRLALRYSDMAGGSARGTIADKVIFHNLKSSSGYVLPGKVLVPEKIVHHTIVNTNLSLASGRTW